MWDSKVDMKYDTLTSFQFMIGESQILNINGISKKARNIRLDLMQSMSKLE